METQVGYLDEHTPDEVQRTQNPKCCDNNIPEINRSLLNSVDNGNSLAKKFRHKIECNMFLSILVILVYIEKYMFGFYSNSENLF